MTAQELMFVLQQVIIERTRPGVDRDKHNLW